MPDFSGWGTARVGHSYYTPGPRKVFGGCCGGFIVFILLVGLAIFLTMSLWSAEVEYYSRLVAFKKVERQISMCNPHAEPNSACHSVGQLVHVSGGNPTGSASDPDFGVSVGGALQISRRVEYCQWDEHSSQTCETCTRTDSDGNSESYDCNCVKQYSYIKAWRSHRILSLGFDQPAAHHNPQRDPYPGRSFASSNARLGSFKLSPRLVENPHGAFRATSRYVDWTKDAKREPHWYDFIIRYFGFVPGGNTRYEDYRNLRGVETSLAAQTDKFHYVGRGGYFFSPYEASDVELGFKYFMEWMEGSLFNWQIGDFTTSCTAGDIRVSFQVADPEEVSVIGGVQGAEGEEIDLYMVGGVRGKEYELGILHEGLLSPTQMFDREAWEGKKWCLIMRFCFFFVCMFYAEALAALLGRRYEDFVGRFAGTVAVEGVLVSVMWAVIWQFGFDSYMQDYAMAALGVVSVFVGFVAFTRTFASPYGSGPYAFISWLRDSFGLRSQDYQAPAYKKEN